MIPSTLHPLDVGPSPGGPQDGPPLQLNAIDGLLGEDHRLDVGVIHTPAGIG
jgi:hypothetical protein